MKALGFQRFNQLKVHPFQSSGFRCVFNLHPYILSRFENVAVKDMINRIAMDGSEKFRVQGRPVVVRWCRLNTSG